MSTNEHPMAGLAQWHRKHASILRQDNFIISAKMHESWADEVEAATQPQPAGVPQQALAGEPIALDIIRWWPDGLPARLEHVWRDLVGFIPNYKLFDLQRVLAEFGFTMVVYENSAASPVAPAAQPAPAHKGEPIDQQDTDGVLGTVKTSDETRNEGTK
jgi:hypothetical protein